MGWASLSTLGIAQIGAQRIAEVPLSAYRCAIWSATRASAQEPLPSGQRARFTERKDENRVAGLGNADLWDYALRISGKLKPRSTASNSDHSARPGPDDA